VGDVVIRPNGPLVFGVFLLASDTNEHRQCAFRTYAEALNHATQVADRSHVDVSSASSFVGPATRIVPGRGPDASEADTFTP
jgi:hypothetical protein